MEQKYIDEFFDSGHLMLSSFHRFSQHADEQRQDTNEGANILTGIGENHTLFAVTRHGHRSVIFCTSTREDESLMSTFGYDGYFRIKNSTEFGAAVANSLAGYQNGLEGFCIYKDSRKIQRDIGSFSLDDLKENPEDKNLSMERLFAATSKVGGPEVFFVKLHRYSEQNEYRFVWNVSHDVTEAVFITCPDAIKCCEKITNA
jgi:hypothetical protein